MGRRGSSIWKKKLKGVNTPRIFDFFVCLLDRILRVTLFYIYRKLNNINNTYISYIYVYILNAVMSLVLTLFFMKIIK